MINLARTILPGGIAILFLLPVLASAPISGPPDADPLRDAWKNASGFLFNEAWRDFRDARDKPGVDPREQALGEAVALLGVQPRTSANLQQARDLFEKIAAQNPTDNAGILARFNLARLAEIDLSPPDEAEARRQYLELLRSAPGRPMAELGASRIACIDLYADIPPEERARRVRDLEALEPLLQTSIGRREFHTAVGLALIEFRADPSVILRHLRAADREGISRRQTEALVWIGIAELARQTGDTALAASYYRKFIDKYHRDNLDYTVRARLREIEKQVPEKESHAG